MKLYTKGGDKRKTSLIGGQRVAKNDIRVEAYGTVDELTAHIALFADRLALRCKDIAEQIIPDIKRINSALMTVEAHLAVGTGGEDKIAPLPDEVVAWIENRIDSLQAELKPITCFTIPGGCEMTSLCHICRTVCRRAERAALRAATEHPVDSSATRYLNRLSDYLYTLGRVLTERLKVEEVLWIP